MRLLYSGFLIVLMLILLYIAATYVYAVYTRYTRERTATSTRAAARVAAKQRELRLELPTNTSRGTDYMIAFDLLANGKRVELPVPEHEFERLREGDTGELSYEGDKFYNFRTG